MFFLFYFILFLYIFRRTVFFTHKYLNTTLFCTKHNLFFKRRLSIKYLNWRRVNFFVLRRKFFKKRVRFFRRNVKDSNFFFKKNFFSILLKTRQFFSKIFFSKKYKRQKELTTYYTKLYKYNLLKKVPFTLIILLQRSGLFTFSNDALYFLTNGFIVLNRAQIFLPKTILAVNDVIQLQIRSNYYLYSIRLRHFFKKKILQNKKLKKLFFFKIFKKKSTFLKKKIHKFFNLFSFFKLNLPTYFELDYVVLTLFIINTSNKYFYLSNFIFYRILNTPMFKLINFKKIN